MRTKRLKKYSLFNLIAGYLIAAAFMILILVNIKPREEIKLGENPIVSQTHTIIEPQKDISINDKIVPSIDNIVYLGSNKVYQDRLKEREINNERISYKDMGALTRVHAEHRNVFTHGNRVYSVDETLFPDSLIRHRGDGRITDRHNDRIDLGLLDRRLAELGGTSKGAEKDLLEVALRKDTNVGGLNTKEKGVDLFGMSPVNGDGLELGDVTALTKNLDSSTKEYGIGKKGQLYAYNFPSLGVGAGVGSSAIGAGVGGGAGLSAAIGEGLLNGESIPTLGGVGDGAKSIYGDPTEPAGVGGLIGGAGAGGAAGLTQGYITEKLGLSAGTGGDAGYGQGRDRNYDHLPKDGTLHIMMHVDGSGSILNTRKQLDIMKDTLLKDALLPYYNNDETLYNKRVTIVDGNGERTLQFFTAATKTANVLALVFQDEAAPAYHLPTFNKKPQDHYAKDLQSLKAGLNRYGGLYRGVMFQVDRGKTFARSFKEFVECAWQGTGYLKNSNLRKYYWQENKHNIEDKRGIVFSDEYHAKSEGDPQYYLDLIFTASKKVGLDLTSQDGGLTDGQYIKTN